MAPCWKEKNKTSVSSDNHQSPFYPNFAITAFHLSEFAIFSQYPKPVHSHNHYYGLRHNFNQIIKNALFILLRKTKQNCYCIWNLYIAFLYSSTWMLHLSTALKKGSYRIQTSQFTDVIRWDRCFTKVRKPQETLRGFSDFFSLPVEMNTGKKTAFRFLDRAVLSLFFFNQQTCIRVMWYFGKCFSL